MQKTQNNFHINTFSNTWRSDTQTQKTYGSVTLVYQFNWFCKASYIGMTSRQLTKRVRDRIPKSIESYCNPEEKETKSTQVLNALKRSSIAEHLCTTQLVQIIIIGIDLK